MNHGRSGEATTDSDPLLQDNDDHPGGRPDSRSSAHGYFLEHVAEGLQLRDRQRKTKELVRYVSFIWAIVSW